MRLTPLHGRHRALGARMVDFAGWDMPLHYGSQVAEHRAVREAAGMFDVSHMTLLDLEGPDARTLLRRLLANDIDRLEGPGFALYSCMLNAAGGVIDDLIVYWVGAERFRVVSNAATREAVLAWLQTHSRGLRGALADCQGLAMIAVQGPQARQRLVPLLPAPLAKEAAALPAFRCCTSDELIAACTGYTGEDGLELMLPASAACELWDRLAGAGVAPAGLGARDSLRLEAGMNLQGVDMDETITPLEAGLGWTVALEPASRAFIGREALEAQRRGGLQRERAGLILEGRGVLRAGQTVYTAGGSSGEVTSGGFSPTLGVAIALARLPAGSSGPVEVEIRGKRLAARIVEPPFVRRGRAVYRERVPVSPGPKPTEKNR